MSHIFPCKNPFQPRKAPPRKATTISPLQMDAAERAQEFGLDYGTALIRLDDEVIFEFDTNEGDWFSDSALKKTQPKSQTLSSASVKDSQQKLLKNSQQLQEENGLLKAKNEILIDMISEVYSEFKLDSEKSKKQHH